MSELQDTRAALAKKELFKAVLAQMEKDFQSCGLDAGFIPDLPADYDKMLNIISSELRKIMAMRTDAVSGLLYRIDVSEKQIKKLGALNENEPFESVVAELIIRRELQKVVIRNLYKNGEL